MHTQSNQAIVITAFGGAENLEWRSWPMPEAAENEIVVKTIYAGVNPVDYKTRQGLGWGAKKIADSLPAVPGIDVAGTVVEAGRNSGFAVGDTVCAANFELGTYARYCALDAAVVAKVPDGVSLQVAAGLPVVGTTALQIVKMANLKGGEHVLVSAPLGGVGNVLMQLLRQYDVDVSVITSPKKAEAARLLGAKKIIDYTADCPAYEGTDADVLIDLVGGDSAVAALAAVREGGRVICVPTIHVPLLQEAGKSRSLVVEGILMKPNRNDLETLLNWVAQGELTIPIAHIYPLCEAAAAQNESEAGRTVGKILLDAQE